MVGVSAQEQIEAPAAPDPPAKQPNSPTAETTNSQGKAKQPKGQGTKGSRTKKGAWGEAADAEPNEVVVEGRREAEPVGRAAVVGIVEPGAAAQQPVGLFLISFQI